MKKVTLIFALVIGFVAVSLAQTAVPRKIEKEHRFEEGNNTVVVAGAGTVRFIHRSEQIQNATFQDTAGKIYKLGIGGSTGDPTAQIEGCDSNCGNCTGGCNKVCIEGYCCYFCPGGTLTSGEKPSESAKPRFEIAIRKKR